MGRQEQIDKICKWMGWHIWEPPRRPREWTTTNEGLFQAFVADFDPFTNPSDCARVMDEVVKRGWEYRITVESAELAFCLLREDIPQYLTWNDLSPFIGESWMEAFCLALLEAIGKE